MLALVAVTDLFAVWAGLVRYDVSGDLVNGAVGKDVTRRADPLHRLSSAFLDALTAGLDRWLRSFLPLSAALRLDCV